MTITEKLDAKRIELGMSHRAFADYLDISVAQWFDTKVGKERMGQKLARGVAKRFPELANEAALAIVDIELREATEAVA